MHALVELIRFTFVCVCDVCSIFIQFVDHNSIEVCMQL